MKNLQLKSNKLILQYCTVRSVHAVLPDCSDGEECPQMSMLIIIQTFCLACINRISEITQI